MTGWRPGFVADLLDGSNKCQRSVKMEPDEVVVKREDLAWALEIVSGSHRIFRGEASKRYDRLQAARDGVKNLPAKE